MSDSRSRKGSGCPNLNKRHDGNYKKTKSLTNYILQSEYLLKSYHNVYLWILKMRASPPRVVNLSLKRSPCGVRSLRDRLPKLPCKAMSPSAVLKKDYVHTLMKQTEVI